MEFEDFIDLRDALGQSDCTLLFHGRNVRTAVSAVNAADLLVAGGNLQKPAFTAAVLVDDLPDSFRVPASLVGAVVELDGIQYRVLSSSRHRSAVCFLTINGK